MSSISPTNLPPVSSTPGTPPNSALAVQQRLKLKQTPIDTWTLSEQLGLASAVLRSGDQNWVSVSRAMKSEPPGRRPSDWFSQKNCALQYNLLLDGVDTPRRKRGDPKMEDDESPGQCIVRRLRAERIKEITEEIQRQTNEIKMLEEEVKLLEPGSDISEAKMDEIEAKMAEEDRQEAEEKEKQIRLMKEREEKKLAIATALKTMNKMPLKGAVAKKAAASAVASNTAEAVKADEDVEATPTSEVKVTSPLLSSLLTSPVTSPIKEQPQQPLEVISVGETKDEVKKEDEQPQEVKVATAATTDTTVVKDEDDVTEEEVNVDNDDEDEARPTRATRAAAAAKEVTAASEVVKQEDVTSMSTPKSTTNRSSNRRSKKISEREDEPVIDNRRLSRIRDSEGGGLSSSSRGRRGSGTSRSSSPTGSVAADNPDSESEPNTTGGSNQRRLRRKSGKLSIPTTSQVTTVDSEFESVPASPASVSDTDPAPVDNSWKKPALAAVGEIVGLGIEALENPDYPEFVLKPVDLSSIKKGVESGSIKTLAEFQRDVNLLLLNLIMINNAESEVKTTFLKHEQFPNFLLDLRADIGDPWRGGSYNDGIEQ